MTLSLSNAKILIVDDNPSFINLLKLMLTEIGVHSVYEAYDFKQGMSHFLGKKPDICIIDIMLKDENKSGIDLATHIKARSPNTPIIFISSFYTEEVYEKLRHLKPNAFMNKELSKFKLKNVLDISLNNKISDTSNSISVKHKNTMEPNANKNELFFKIGDSYKKILMADICFFFSKDRVTYARVNARNYPITVKLKDLEEKFSPCFQRIHKSYLVNVSYIEQINIKNQIVIVNNESLPIGYAYRKNFLKHINILK